MKVSVHLFAILREFAGTGQLELEVPGEVTPLQVAEMLAERLPKLRPHVTTLSFAVNGEIVAAHTPIKAPAEVALLPPVSGG